MINFTWINIQTKMRYLNRKKKKEKKLNIYRKQKRSLKKNLKKIINARTPKNQNLNII